MINPDVNRTEYAMLLQRNPASGRLTATIPDLPGFHCEVDSADEARAILQDAVSAWMAAQRRSGEAIPTPVEYTLDRITIASDDVLPEDRSAAQQFAESVSAVFRLTEDARREFVIAEGAVMDDRYGDAVRHVEWCTDLLMQAHALLDRFPPHGELERVHKLLGYGIALSTQAARLAMHGTCERDVTYVRQAEEQYVKGMESTKAGLAELRRFVTQS